MVFIRKNIKWSLIVSLILFFKTTLKGESASVSIHAVVLHLSGLNSFPQHIHRWASMYTDAQIRVQLWIVLVCSSVHKHEVDVTETKHTSKHCNLEGFRLGVLPFVLLHGRHKHWIASYRFCHTALCFISFCHRPQTYHACPIQSTWLQHRDIRWLVQLWLAGGLC